MSYITDTVSVIQGSRVFLLAPGRTVWYRVEYAMFLLNKDVEQLLARCGLGCPDVRMTLGNLLSLGMVVGEAGGGGGVLKRVPVVKEAEDEEEEGDSGVEMKVTGKTGKVVEGEEKRKGLEVTMLAVGNGRPQGTA